MKRINEFRNFLIMLVAFFTPELVVGAYQDRGYFAIGGEWLLIPIIFFIGECLKGFIKMLRSI